MDFDNAKENIQPLAAGRNASILQAALQADSQQELQQQRRQYEEAIKNYEGEDLLEPWFDYIYWIEQSFPSGGKESGLEEVLLKCLTKFEKDERYHQDRRMIKLYIKYIDTHENPQECYQQLYNQGIGTMVADLYICWAYYYDLSGNFPKADQIFKRGIDCHAEPFEELQEAHQHFGFTMSQRILYVDDTSKQKYQSTLIEKRQALTSLKSHRKKVGSVRTGAAIKSFAPGKVQINSKNPSCSSRNINISVFEDENQDPNAIPPPEPCPEQSVVKTILDSARKQENVKEPGPWNKAHDKKQGKLFASENRTDLGFEILEDDEDLMPIKGKVKYGQPFIYFDGFVSRNKTQEEWNLPVTLENELIPRSYPSYDKCLLYPQPNMEYSLEELGCYYWCKQKNIENNFTKKYDTVWKSSIEKGVRMYPNFAKKNNPLPEELATPFDPMEGLVAGKSKLVFDPKLCYPSENEQELQFEEVMYHRWKCGERKLKYGGNETIAITEEMEETICLPKEAVRRKSFFPTRKSIAPSQFSRFSNVEETNEEDEEVAPLPSTSTARRSVIMKTPKKVDRTEPIHSNEGEVDNDAFAFKTPAAPPVKQKQLNFQIYEEEENNYEGNETCSTQVFNCFLKAQSVSTPKAVTKAKSSLAERQPMQLNFSGVENATPAISNPTAVFSPPEYNDAGLTLQCKQLSTIMETSEQATGHTASTKSSINSADFEVEAHQSKMPLAQNVCATNSPSQKETPEVLLMKSLRFDDVPPTVRQHMELFRLEQREDTVPNLPAVKMFEDKTETVQKNLICKAGNFSRLENKEDTVPSIKPVRFHEDKTETITKMVLAPKIPMPCGIPADDDMLELFAKSPVKGVPVENIFNSPLPPAAPAVANKSIFSASAFMNFRDSPDAKVKCNYDSPEVRAKCQSLTGVKKLSNLSLLPCFDDTMETDGGDKKKTSKPTEFSFLTGIPSQTRGQEKSTSFLQEARRQESKNNSVLPGFPDGQLSGDVQPKQRSKEDSFLSGFPSVTVGSNKPREDSFMSYLSNVGDTKVKKGIEDSFLKKFSSSSDQMNSTESFMKFSTSIADESRTKRPASTSESFMQSFKVPGSGDKMDSTMSRALGNSFLPNLSIANGPVKHKIALENSFMPNLSTNNAAPPSRQKLGGDSFLSSLSTAGTLAQQRITGDSFMPNLSIKEKSSIQKGTESFMTNPSKSSEDKNKTTQNLTDNIAMEDLSTKETSKTSNKSLQKPKIVSILTMKPPEDSFKLDLSTSSMSCKIPACSKNPSIEDNSSKLPQMNQSDCSMSFLNSFTAPEPIKQSKHGEKFSIFMDSNCQQSPPPPVAANQDKKFTIFEDSTCKKISTSTNKTSSFDTSLKPDDFFEDNIRTEAFQANLSMIKNSTWLPNHFPRQSQIKEQSLNIKEESISGNDKSSGLSIFSSVPQDKSCEIMPPPPTLSRPKESNKFTSKPTPSSSHPQPTDCIEIAESDEEEDFGKSIYYTKTPKTPNIVRHVWSPDTDQTPIQNYFVHPHAELDQTQQVIDDYTLEKDVNPFNKELTNAFLHQIDFTNYIEKLPTCDMVRKIQPLRKDCTITINDVSFNVLKLVGEGSFGAVYCAKEPHSGRMFALKQERPANLWEYYICLELQCRLKSNEILAGFINIDYALIGNNAGVLVSQFSRYGSLITVCNKIKKVTLKNVDEYVVMHMTSQLLLIMDHLHAANIIHADIKADNFLLMEKLVYGRKQPSIQLIDFGNAIDMSLLKKGQTFMFSQQEECFKCVEMREKRPWTFQLDLYGLAGVIHVLLFGKYMEISKKVAGWTHQTHIPRYFKKSLWNTIFHTLLNIDDCQTMPNLQNLRAQLEEEIAENDKSVCQKIVEFNRALDM